MHRLDSGREGKLRAACDRCHDLKNRCVRAGGPDSRCDRCERLDIDCVYRNTSRIGRPRTQRRSSLISQPQPPGRESYQNENREARHRQDLDKRSIDASISGTGANRTETEASGNTTLIESPSDVMSLLVSPEVVQQADMDWNLDFSDHINGCIPGSLYQDTSRPLPRSSDTSSFPESTSAINAEQTIERLLQLQGQLHRLLWPTDPEPGADLVEESLEVMKTFLEILQATLVAQGRLPVDYGITLTTETTKTATGWQAGSIGEPVPEGTAASSTEGAGNVRVGSPLKQSAPNPAMNYVIAQQALTCYSYMLLMLDRVVGVLVSSDYSSAPGRVDSESSQRAFSLGFFNLASQPALNAGVVLHLVLRMVQRLCVLIQMVVTGCKDIQDGASASPSTTVVEGMPQKGISSAASISATFHAAADLVSERETLLVERLSYLTSGV